MKQSELKKLIKESVREVFKEELVRLLRESPQVKQAARGVNTPVNESKPPAIKSTPPNNGSSIFQSMIEETKSTMTSSEYKDIIGGTAQMAKPEFAPVGGTGDGNPVMLESTPSLESSSPLPDFLTNAKAIFDKANKK